MRTILYALVWAGVMAWVWPAGAETLGDPKTAGADDGPISVLFFGAATLDATYRQELSDRGFTVAVVDCYQPYRYEFFRKFNVIVIDAIPRAGEQWNTFGQKMLYYWSNMEHVNRCLREGAGVLVHAYMHGGGKFGGWNQQMKPWGAQVLRAVVRDSARGFSEWQAYGKNMYCWTENLVKHPTTDGLKRIYYPSANLRLSLIHI